MKLAFSTNAYTRHSLSDALRGIKSAGFEGVEILADVPHAYPGQVNDSFTASVRRTLDETGYNITETARRLDVTRAHVYNLIRTLGIERGDRR